MQRTDILGIVASVVLGTFIVTVGIALTILTLRSNEAQRRYEECIASIPNTLDAAEIVKQEERCRQ